jgi:hypothetical protein
MRAEVDSALHPWAAGGSFRFAANRPSSAEYVLSLGGWAQARQRSASEASESSLLRNRLTPPGLVRLPCSPPTAGRALT